MTGPWEAESEDQCGGSPSRLELGLQVSWGTLPTADIEAKLRRLTAIDYSNRNWSWLLDPNRPPKTPVILKVPASGKIQSVSEAEEPAQEEILSTVDLGKSRVSGRTVPTKDKRAHTQSSRVLRAKVDPSLLYFFVSRDYFSGLAFLL